MAYSKSFPKKSDKSVYPQWEEVLLTPAEEEGVEKKCRLQNTKIMAECLHDAQKIFVSQGQKGYETSIATIAASLFEKRASHVAFMKEEFAKEKFNE